MPEYDNNMTGVLFKQHDKKSDRSPDFTGSIEIEGVKYRLAGWTKEKKSDGEKFLSLRVSKDERQTQPEQKPISDADIPW